MAARIILMVGAAVLLRHADAFADNPGLLNGRYSFVMQGTWNTANNPLDEVTTRVGTIVFDGNGHITALRVRQVVTGQERLWDFGGPDTDYPFVDGTYTLRDNNLGLITFTCQFPPTPSSPTVALIESWDIAVANGGKSLYIMVHHAKWIDVAGFVVDHPVTISGEAKAN